MKMNFRMSTFLRFFCCLILLASSINSLDNDDNSGEDESHSKNSIEDQLKRFSVELKRSKERKELLKFKFENIDEALNELKSTVDGIKLRVNESDTAHDRRLTQLSDEINSFKKGNVKLQIEVNAINKILSKNKVLEKPGIPFIDFHKCKKSLDIKNNKPTFSWTISGINKKMNQTTFEIESDIFPLKGYSMKARAKLLLVNERLFCYLSLKDNNKSSEDIVDVKVLPNVIYVFNYTSEFGHFGDDRIRNTFPRFNETIKYDTNVYGNLLLAYGYDSDDKVVMDIYVETPEQAAQSCSDDGTITGVIHEVSEMRDLERSMRMGHFSPYFYSGPKGYRMVVGFKLSYHNYHRRKNALRLESVPIKGPYDDGLNKSFTINTTATFFHPTDATKNIVKNTVVSIPPKKNEPNSMISVTNKELERVLINDTLYYQITNKFM